MSGYKIQLKDKNGNRQYPVSTVTSVVDADGVSVADLLDRKQPTLVSGVNIKTINGKTLLGEGDLVIEGGSGDGSASVETRVLYVYLEGAELTEEEKAYNKETYDKIANGENVQLVFDILGIPVTHAFYDEGILFTCSVVVIEGSALYGQGRLFSDGNYEYEEGVIGGSSGEAAESDVICVVWDDDTSDIPSNKEAYQKLAESINTVGKPAAVMVCVESGYRWGIAKYYWKSNVGGDIELTTPVTESGLYCVFTLTSEGVCTASYKQADLGGGSDSSNVVSFYIPLMDDSREVVTYEDCINEITTRFADSISQEVIDAITSHFQSMIDHNVASFAELEERLRNGEKPLIVMRGFTYWMFVLTLYLWAVAEGGGMDMTDEELIEELDLLANIYEVIYPESYMMDFYEDSGAALEVTVESIDVSIGANGNWEKQGEVDVRKTATLYYEGAARLTAKECETNLKSKGYRLNNCDFQVNRYEGGGWSDDEDILIIGKSTKTVSDFVDLDGTVSTRDVVVFRYLDDLNMVELQVSTHDGYCRKVVLGQLQLA